jgi:chemotaxis protein MotA
MPVSTDTLPADAAAQREAPPLRTPRRQRRPESRPAKRSGNPSGIVITLLLIVVGMAVAASGNGSPASFFDLPSAVIVIGGTAAATLVSSPWADLRDAAAAVTAVCTPKPGDDPLAIARTLVELARTARQSGVLALQGRTKDASLPLYLRRGIGFAVDGSAEDEVDTLLRLEAHAATERARQPAAVFRRAADYAPAMGLIGTLIGLVQMLGRLDDPSAIGPSLAVALLTTFYGAVLANVALGPLASKLERRAADEAMVRTMIRFAILLIIRRENPGRLEVMLNSVLPPDRQLPHAPES